VPVGSVRARGASVVEVPGVSDVLPAGAGVAIPGFGPVLCANGSPVKKVAIAAAIA
jgi:hypothetical protein